MAEATKRKVGRDLTEGSIIKGVFAFVGPIILANLLQQVYSMVDLMVIGQYVGNVGTVGVSVGGEIADFITPFAAAFGIAGQVYIAQLLGAKRTKDLQESIGSFLTFMMIISAIFAVAVIALSSPILKLLNCPEDAFASAQSYMIVTAIGYPFIFGYNAVCGILRGMGESKRPLIFIIVAAVVNIFLDLLLVAVIPLDAAGTAIATAASQLASFIASFIYMYRIREAIGFRLSREYFKVRWVHLKAILKIGIPQAIRSILVHVSMFWVNANINSYGMIASGTNSVGNKILKFLEIFSSSMSQAGGSAIGQNIGAQKYDRARKVVFVELTATLIVAAISTGLILVIPRPILGIFTQDQGVIEMGVVWLEIMIVHFFSSAVTSSFQSMVIGSGNATLNLIIGLLDGIVCKIGLSVLFLYAFDMGLYSFFWATALSRVLPGIVNIVYFISGKWKRARLIEKKA